MGRWRDAGNVVAMTAAYMGKYCKSPGKYPRP